MLLLQLCVNGLVAGAVYSLMAVGFALIYNSTRMFHIAHGAVFTIAAYAFYFFAVTLSVDFWLSAVAGIAAAALLGVLMEVGIYRPIRRLGGGLNSVLIASLGLMVLLQSLYAIAFSTETLTIRQGMLDTIIIGGIAVTSLNLVVGAIAIVAFVAIELFLRTSKYGQAIRALADNPTLANIQGIGTGRLYIIIFLVGSALAGVAGILVSLDVGVRPEMGLLTVLVAIVAVIVGGVGYLPGALVGAFILGVLQQVSIWKINSAWQEGVVFALLLIFLVTKPDGLFGGRFRVRQA